MDKRYPISIHIESFNHFFEYIILIIALYVFRFFLNTAPAHAAYGGSVFLAYTLIYETLRHHDEDNRRPKFIDHTFAMTVIGAVGFGIQLGFLPRHLAQGALVGGATLGPMLWWLKLNAKFGGNIQPSNIFYEDDVTQEEVARYRAQDVTEQLAHEMMTMPGYGYITKDQRFV